MVVDGLFLAVPWGCLRFVIVVFPDHTHLLFSDQNKYVAAILVELSKAINCLPHDLLLLKLKTYGLSRNALN